MRRLDLPQVTLDARHAGELLAHPCRCGMKNCTLGDHVWRSTLDMRDGVRAHNQDPKVSGNGSSDGTPAELGPSPHAEYKRRVVALKDAALDLKRFIDGHRPDRTVPANQLPMSSNEDWCTNCLGHGYCNPRHRGDSCRDCYDFTRVYPDLERPRALIVAKQSGSKVTQQMVDRAVSEARQMRRSQRRKAS